MKKSLYLVLMLDKFSNSVTQKKRRLRKVTYFASRVSEGWAKEYVKEVKRQKHHLKIQIYESIYHIGRMCYVSIVK